MTKKLTKTKKAFILCFIVVALILAFFAARSTKVYGQLICNLFKQELTAIADDVIKSHNETRWHGMRVRYEESPVSSDYRVIFETTGFGIVPSSDIKGLYYSPDDRIITGYLPYSPSDNGLGYFAEESNGDNRFYTEPLDENWFWCTEHY